MINYEKNHRYITLEGETETQKENLNNFLNSNGYIYEEDDDATMVFAKERVGNDVEVNNHKMKIMERVTKEEMDEILDSVADSISDIIANEITSDMIIERIDDELDNMDLGDDE